MLKKWSYILISVWLINALVCLHPARTFESAYPGTLQFSANYYNGKTSNTPPRENNHKATPDHKVYGNKCVFTRAADFITQLPVLQNFHYTTLAQVISFNYSRFWENQSFLPPHHHFLFRLSPF